MKRIFTSVLAFIAFTLATYAQTTIPNGTFESWANVGSSTEEPTHFNSNKTGGGYADLGPQTCFRDTSTLFGGSYCTKIETSTFFGTVVNGSCATGEIEAPTTNKADGYIQTVPGSSTFSSAFTGRPDSVSFYYRFSQQGTDTPSVQVRLHVGAAYSPEVPSNGNHPDSTVNIISRALWAGPGGSQATWKRASVPFVYVDSRTPQYILITMTGSGDQLGGTSGTTLWVDEMVAIYNPKLTTDSVAIVPYYVSATQGTTVSVPFTMSGPFVAGNTVTAQLSDASGSFASPVTIGSILDTVSGTITATIPAGTASGTAYRIRVVSSSPVVTAADNGSNITIYLCSNSIAPTASQTIAANTNGNALIVTETPTAASRVWEYSTTSGGPYSGFGTAQTGTTYTPNFSTAGTYYVVCISTYPGSLQVTSNEDTINVVSNSIAPSASQTIAANTNGTMLTVTETPAGTSRQWEYSTTSGGPYSGFSTAQTGTTYTPNFPTAGTYYVVCVSVIDGVTTTSNQVTINVASNSITPAATQTIPVNTNGTMLTVTEAPAAVSREWEYSTVSGGPYSSFPLPQTGLTYTPNSPVTGTFYLVCISSYTGGTQVTSNEVIINVVSDSISPSAAQTIAANTSGNTLTVTQTPPALSQVWEYSTTSGGPYSGFSTAQTGTTYTPEFATAGTYYVVCISTYAGASVTSNEVAVTVVSNSIAPSSSQSLLTGVSGTTLTVTETPAGTSREWEYSTTSGGPYSSFGPAQTGTTYTPLFTSAGTYYVVCLSVIDGVTATSNEVLISVGSATITTGSVLGSPYLFSPSAPDANVSVPYTTSGTFNAGNIFTAQLSDASGSFSAPLAIGTLSSTASGTVASVIPHTTAAGTGYRIRVVGSSPVILGGDNGVDLVVDQFHNSIAPTSLQTLALSAPGTALTVTASQTGSQVWEYTTTSGSGYQQFAVAQTGSSYTPQFNVPGTYYVVCKSINQYNDTALSNEVTIVVNNGNTLTTSAVSGSPYLVSAHANVMVTVNYTSNAVFSAGNTFTAQLSDATGSFASPVTIGSVTATALTPISAQIPDASVSGTAYRIRVISSNPALTGTDNGTNLVINQFQNSIAPGTIQSLTAGTAGNALTVTASQPGSQVWEYTTTSGSGYVPFSPAQTGSSYTPLFATPGTYYVVCMSINASQDTVTSNEVTVVVGNGTTLSTSAITGSPFLTSPHAMVMVTVNYTSNVVYNSGNVFTAQLSDATGSFSSPYTLGQSSGTTLTPISAQIPDAAPAGTGYRIRVISTSPAITGTDNGTNLSIVPFAVSAAPLTAQNIHTGYNGAPVTITENQPAIREWAYTTTSGSGYLSFSPRDTGATYVPNFPAAGTYYVICHSTNTWMDTLTTPEITINVTDSVNGISIVPQSAVKLYWNSNTLMIDLSNAALTGATLSLMNINGQTILGAPLRENEINAVPANVAAGVYIYRIVSAQQTLSGKLMKE